jgi:hypothetical protein
MTDHERLKLTGKTAFDLAFFVERVTRIELALSAWEADVLPLNYTREEPGTGRRGR